MCNELSTRLNDELYCWFCSTNGHIFYGSISITNDGLDRQSNLGRISLKFIVNFELVITEVVFINLE